MSMNETDRALCCVVGIVLTGAVYTMPFKINKQLSVLILTRGLLEALI